MTISKRIGNLEAQVRAAREFKEIMGGGDNSLAEILVLHAAIAARMPDLQALTYDEIVARIWETGLSIHEYCATWLRYNSREFRDWIFTDGDGNFLAFLAQSWGCPEDEVFPRLASGAIPTKEG